MLVILSWMPISSQLAIQALDWENAWYFSLVFFILNTNIFKTDRQANTSRICTKYRHLIENCNAMLWSLKLSGLHHAIPQQLLGASESQRTPELPRIAIWESVIDAVVRRNMKPLLSSYAIPPGMSYSDVGRLTLQRLVCQLINNRLVIKSKSELPWSSSYTTTTTFPLPPN